MYQHTNLNDIADELLILNKITVERLYSLKNCADCIALYIFYYKIAKWQKTNVIKATDDYVKKSLKWGIDKIRNTKQTLKENGLINIVQRRENGKIVGWYIEVSYIVSQTKTDDIKIKVEETNNTQNQQHPKATSGEQEINALKEHIKCLNKEIEMLKNKLNIYNKEKISKKEIDTEFESLWKRYPRKKSRERAYNSYAKARQNGTTYDEVINGLENYLKEIEVKKTETQYIKHGSTWFSQHCWQDEYVTMVEEKPNEYDNLVGELNKWLESED